MIISNRQKEIRIQHAQDLLIMEDTPALATFATSDEWFQTLGNPIVVGEESVRSRAAQSATTPVRTPVLIASDSVTHALHLADQGIVPTILVFASAHRCGGGFLDGAVSQEEDVSLLTTWTFQAKKASAFYEAGARCSDAMNADAVIWINKGLILASEPGQWLMTPARCSFVGFAAPNARGLRSQGVDIDRPDYHKKIAAALVGRCQSVMALAHRQQASHLILGAIGCGVFSLEPDMVANCWKTAIELSPYAGAISFALPGGPKSVTGQVFATCFGSEFAEANHHASLDAESKPPHSRLRAR